MNNILSAINTLDAQSIISNGALRGRALPSRLKLLKWGDNATTKGNFKVGPKTVEKLAANQQSLGFERVALDYDHCSIQGTPAHEELIKNSRPPIIFGYGRPNVVSGEGLFLEDMTWTPLGVDNARQFEDLSPALHDNEGEVDFIHSVALTPNGAVHGLTFFSAGSGRLAPLRAIARAVAAFEREIVAREGRGLIRLSGSDSGAQAVVSAGPKVNPEPVQAPLALTSDQIAMAVFAALEGDIVGSEARAALRSQVSRKVSEAWNESQKQRPGPRSPNDYAQFRTAIDEGTSAAVLGFARLKITNPADVMVAIAASNGLPGRG